MDIAVPVGFPKPKGDYRYVGPVTECPVCQGTWMHVLASWDPETNMPGAWLLDVMCIDCDVLLAAPTPMDEIVREGSIDDVEA
jgi:hypothetical protein